MILAISYSLAINAWSSDFDEDFRIDTILNHQNWQQRFKDLLLSTDRLKDMSPVEINEYQKNVFLQINVYYQRLKSGNRKFDLELRNYFIAKSHYIQSIFEEKIDGKLKKVENFIKKHHLQDYKNFQYEKLKDLFLQSLTDYVDRPDNANIVKVVIIRSALQKNYLQQYLKDVKTYKEPSDKSSVDVILSSQCHRSFNEI